MKMPRTAPAWTAPAAALLAAALMAVCCGTACAAGTRSPAVAGAFYPERAEALQRKVEDFLADADPAVPRELRGRRPRVLIVPHAGYRYSGEVAALSYKLLKGTEKPSRVLLLGPSHTVYLTHACSVPDYSAYSTPLGEVPVDGEACRRLAAKKPFTQSTAAHRREHCLEVQLPFLQAVWPEPPPIVPVVTGRLEPAERSAAAHALAPLLDEDTLLVISTDFTHYGPRFRYTPFEDASGEELQEKIRQLDMEGVGYLKALDRASFRNYLLEKKPTICGAEALNIMLLLMANVHSVRPVFLRWSSSAEVTGGGPNCVSYVAMAFYDAPGSTSADAGGRSVGPLVPDLTSREKSILLRVAREAVRAGFEEDASPAPPEELTDTLRRPYGAFVTLKKGEEVRGHAGATQSTVPLWLCVRRMAKLAAFQNPRYSPLGRGELPEAHIEISVVGPLTAVREVDDLVVGRDGVIVQDRSDSALMLPEAATDHGWTSREFLAAACRKAGLAPDAWEKEGVEVLRFSATTFAE